MTTATQKLGVLDVVRVFNDPHLPVRTTELWFLKMSSRRNRTRRVEGWRVRSSPTMASVGGALSVLACRSADLRWWRELRPRMADTSDQFQELKPRADSDDANRSPAE